MGHGLAEFVCWQETAEKGHSVGFLPFVPSLRFRDTGFSFGLSAPSLEQSILGWVRKVLARVAITPLLTLRKSHQTNKIPIAALGAKKFDESTSAKALINFALG